MPDFPSDRWLSHQPQGWCTGSSEWVPGEQGSGLWSPPGSQPQESCTAIRKQSCCSSPWKSAQLLRKWIWGTLLHATNPQGCWAQLSCTCDTLTASLGHRGWHSTAPYSNLSGGIPNQHIPSWQQDVVPGRGSVLPRTGGHPPRLAGHPGAPHTPGSLSIVPSTRHSWSGSGCHQLRKAENRLLICPRWAPVCGRGLVLHRATLPIPMARDWQGRQEQRVYMSHKAFHKVIKALKSTGIPFHSSPTAFLQLIPRWGSPGYAAKSNPSSCSEEQLWIFGCLFYQWKTIPETQDANINSETAVLTYRYQEK